MAYFARIYRGLAELNDLEKPTPRASKHDRSKREKITTFSKPSQRRLLRTLHRVNRRDKPFFITLTYPEQDGFFTNWKPHINRFIESLRYYDRRFCGLWRLEFQLRGTPHFHVVAFSESLQFESEVVFASRVAESWCRIIGATSRDALQYAARAERAVSSNAVYRYLVGHHTKTDQVLEGVSVGRYWACFGRRYLNLDTPLEQSELTVDEFHILRRWAKRYLISNARTYRGAKRKRYLRSARTLGETDSGQWLIPNQVMQRWIQNLKDTLTPF